jgi:hypothetical protein
VTPSGSAPAAGPGPDRERGRRSGRAAEAVTDFANCDHLHRTFKYGVARSDRAANYQQRTGHYRPAVRPKVYRVNDESDADNDGTACEVTR